jgi:lipopolysaccharide export system permease protein
VERWYHATPYATHVIAAFIPYTLHPTPVLKKLDKYIIGKFLGTFFFSIVLIMSIAVVFDLTEKLDDFFENQAPINEIIFDYYLNFIPYYMNMFSPLFIFISVIFFTSKIAGNSEIIAILASGVSYHRLMFPYFFSAFVLFVMSFILTGYVIPPASAKMLNFQDKYVQRFTRENARNIQMEVDPGTILYIQNFQKRTNTGYRASFDRFDGKRLTMRIVADRIQYDSLYNWHFVKYVRRDFDNMHETLTRGERMDTIIPVLPKELFYTIENAQMMTNTELKGYIDTQRRRGAGNVQAFEIEWWKRWASPIGAFIMTLLGVTLSSKKVRGGMGKNLGIGVALSAFYILFSTVSTTFAVNGVMSPFMSAWLPNFMFLGVGLFLYIRVSR